MSLDDLAGDGQPQARMAAERRALGAGGVEALKYRFQVFRRNARSIILDRGDHVAARAFQMHAHLARRLFAVAGKGAGIVDQVAEHLAQRPFPAEYMGAAARAEEAHMGLARLGRLPVEAGDVRQEPLQVQGPRRIARQLRVQARGVGDVCDQPVQPLYVLLENPSQAVAGRRVADQVQGFDRRAD